MSPGFAPLLKFIRRNTEAAFKKAAEDRSTDDVTLINCSYNKNLSFVVKWVLEI